MQHLGPPSLSLSTHRSSPDLVRQPANVLCYKGRAESAHLVDDAAQGPHVALVAVALVHPDLGAHVVRRPDLRPRQSLFQELGAPEVANLDLVRSGKEDVLRLDIAVEDLVFMEHFEGRADLGGGAGGE